MPDRWPGQLQLFQTSPFPPAERCDLALVRTQGSVLVALVVDGAPGRSTVRPPWPREAIFDVVAPLFGESEDPEAMLRAIGERLRQVMRQQPWRLFAAASALRWDTSTATVDLAVVGDNSAWLVRSGSCAPLVDPGRSRPGSASKELLGGEAPHIRVRQSILAAEGTDRKYAIALLSDGGYSLLSRRDGKLPGRIEAWSIDQTGTDDATLLLLRSPD